MPRRLEIALGRANTSEITGMVSIFEAALQLENPKLERIVHRPSSFGTVVEDILKTHLHSEHHKFMIAYDTTEGLVAEPGFEEEQSSFDEDMSCMCIRTPSRLFRPEL